MLQRLQRMSSTRLIPLSFFVAILMGAILLYLPIATVEGESTSFLTALFTSTTSICVTGLTTVTTATHWTMFGKVVILFLIQIGGLGIVTITALLAVLLGEKLTIQNRVLIRDSFNLETMRGLVRFMIHVIILVCTIEGLGAFIYATIFIPKYGFATGLWYGIFHSVSAFCNAGIDLLGDDSLMQYNDNILLMTNTMFLIISGGLGYIVWFDIFRNIELQVRSIGRRKKRRFRLNEHSKLVLTVTTFLIISGAIIIYAIEYNNMKTLGTMPIWQKIYNSLFQSVTFRTAGFATISQANMEESTAFIGCLFMFIGGSPVGTAGGVKTITFFVLIASTLSYILGREETVIFQRKIGQELIRKSLAILIVSLIVTLVSSVILATTNHIHMLDALYETFSATATVGLSRDITPSLNTAGQCLIIFCMYAGRIGPISMATFLRFSNVNKSELQHANGHFLIG